MIDVAVSQLTSSRWDLNHEVERAVALGFQSMSLWRPKVSDLGTSRAARILKASGVRASSLQWAGGFTGGDGRSFDESVEDAVEAIVMAAAVSAPVLVIHSGCRSGHTKSHARRLLVQAFGRLAPLAARAGVALAVKPVHPDVAAGCSFLSCLTEALELVESVGDPSVRLALDLWHFAHEPAMEGMLPRLALASAVVQVADRCGPPTDEADRLPAGHGVLPLEHLVAGLVAHGYAGTLEFDPVGEAVEILGYEGVWQETRLVADAWASRSGDVWTHAAAATGDATAVDHFRAGGVGSRRSHASSHSGSPG